MYAARYFTERNQVAFQITNLVFMRLAHVENEKVVAAIESRFQFTRSDFGDLHIGCGSFFAAYAAEFIVVDELCDGAMRATHWAVGILAQLEFAEFHSQRVKQKQAANKTVAAAQN